MSVWTVKVGWSEDNAESCPRIRELGTKSFRESVVCSCRTWQEDDGRSDTPQEAHTAAEENDKHHQPIGKVLSMTKEVRNKPTFI